MVLKSSDSDGLSSPIIEQEIPNKDLFFEDSAHEKTGSRKPWWKTQFFVVEPVLFGTWDGVFTSCLINIFGIVLFLRTGWMVGNVGICLAVLVVCMTIAVALSTALSAIGICERINEMSTGGIYLLVSKVLGGKLGGTVGLMYSFGLCVVCALYCTGFAESVTHSLQIDNVWATRGVACGTLALLLAINLAGVKWVIRLQLVLLVVLLISTSDFVIGTIIHTDPEAGFVGYSFANLANNSYSSYQEGESFFSIFGVFFPTATGIMAGVNMSGDLKKPSESIPTGTLSAICLSFLLYLVFVMLLGSTCTREALQTDFMIAEKVSAVGFLWLMGLYMSSSSSCSTGLYGAPRVLQSIANENVIPGLGFLGKGFGANKTPIIAICVVGCTSLVFILVGSLNIISPIITCNFMLVYACVDYSYFALSMSYDIDVKNTLKFKNVAKNEASELVSQNPRHFSYGTTRNDQHVGTMNEFTKDLDFLINEPKADSNKPLKDTKVAKKTNKEYLEETFRIGSSKNEANQEVSDSGSEDKLDNSNENTQFEKKAGLSRKTSSSSLEKCASEENPEKHESERVEKNDPKNDILPLPKSWYSFACNRYLSLFAAFMSIVIMFLINWIYALFNILTFLIIYMYTSLRNPGLHPGAASSFHFADWLAASVKNLFTKKTDQTEQYIVQPEIKSPCSVVPTQITFDNADFASRSRFHQSEVGNYNKDYASLVSELKPLVVQPSETLDVSSS